MSRQFAAVCSSVAGQTKSAWPRTIFGRFCALGPVAICGWSDWSHGSYGPVEKLNAKWGHWPCLRLNIQPSALAKLSSSICHYKRHREAVNPLICQAGLDQHHCFISAERDDKYASLSLIFRIKTPHWLGNLSFFFFSRPLSIVSSLTIMDNIIALWNLCPPQVLHTKTHFGISRQ